MNILRLAWLTTVRQPSRTALGVLGVAAIGALLFDMLLLSRGLVVSFRDLLDRAGFDVRVLATDSAPFAGIRLSDAESIAARIRRSREIAAAVPVGIRDTEVESSTPVGGGHDDDSTPRSIQFIGSDPNTQAMWTLLEGHDLSDETTARPVIVNRNVAERWRLNAGSPLVLRGKCGSESEVMPPVSFVVVGVAEFPFDDAGADTVAGRLSDLRQLCGDKHDGAADMLLVRSNPNDGADAAAAAIKAAYPALHVVTNDELVARFSRVEFSYFRQISFVLATVTMFFGFLLMAVLLTASVNQRLGEIAALRAVGLSRMRVVAGVLCESMMMVGMGAILAIPVGTALSYWLDDILRSLPGIPAGVHFFVFEMRALALYAGLLSAASVGAALYPMRIVAMLPIAATLRREVVG